MKGMKGAILAASALLPLLASCVTRQTETPPEIVVLVPDAAKVGSGGFYVDFVNDVVPVLESRCLGCHNKASGITSLSFEKREYLVAQNDARHLVIPGEPERSSLFLVTVLPEHFAEAMPREGHRLGKGETWLVYQWILQGADWPEDVVLRDPNAPAGEKAKKRVEGRIPPDVI